MKLGFVTPSISRQAGGIFEIQRRLCQELSKFHDTNLSVLGLHDDYTIEDLSSWAPISPKLFPHVGPAAFRYSPKLNSELMRSNFDLVHIHVLWMGTSLAIRRWHLRHKRPYIVTINGMLEPWALRNSRWKKAIALRLFEHRNLVAAACLCVNSENELKSIRRFGLRNPVAVISNGIDMPELWPQQSPAIPTDQKALLEQSFLGSNYRTLLYLGRIHPKKGLTNLIHGLVEFRDSSQSISLRPSESTNRWKLLIAGWDELSHEAELKRLATKLGLRWVDLREQPKANPIGDFDIVFSGPQFGDAKAICFNKCDAIILPSFSEGLPMVILEAWAYGKPVLMTPQCNLPEGFSVNAAILVEPSVQSIANGLAQLDRLSDSERIAMGQRGKTLVMDRFAWDKVAKDVHDVSSWAVHGGAPPDCVRFA